jgi:D-alanyl-lipoteichoic acid acyltransferase DltB (MBOAT superfamily)
MSDFTIDLFRLRIWFALGGAVLVLVPLTGAVLRKWAWAVVNLGFLWLMFGDAVVAPVLGGVLIAYASLRLIDERRLGLLPVTLGGVGALSLFLLHKLPALSSTLGLGGLNPILTAIGFSYVALRLVDVLRLVAEKSQPAPDLPSTVNYLLPFHMLAAGPIQGYADFVAQPAVPPAPGVADALRGIERITFGLFKKFVLAGIIEKVFLFGFRDAGWYLLVEAQFYYLWLYLDFSAYSDIAVGAGHLLGVATPENFNKPYLARNMIDYWERWHISLSQFIRRNLFIPIQLYLLRRTRGRAALLCATLAFSSSFLLCGLWHGVHINWLAWGALQAVGLVIANLYREFLTRKLGRSGVKRYLAHPGIRLGAIVLTQEFVAFSLLVGAYPWS